MGFELRHVAPTDLHEWWETISDDLETCRLQDTGDVWLEDIYACIKYGHATLHVGLVDGRYGGFIILTVQTDAHTARQHLHVWYCSNHDGFDILTQGQVHLEEMARRMNASKITLRADRMSFERLLRPLGYRIGELELVKELDDG